MAKRKRKAKADTSLIEIYDKVTCLEILSRELKTTELETLSAEIYNALLTPLNAKRRVLLNELLDIEVELRVRNQA